MVTVERTAVRTAVDVARRLGVAPDDVRLAPLQGVANHTVVLGADLVLRIARPGHERGLDLEAVVLPLAAAAGLPVPEIVEHAPGREGAPPYLVQQFVPGARLDHDGLDAEVRRDGHRDLGRLLARLHAADLHVDARAARLLPVHPDDPPQGVVQRLADDGWIGARDAPWLLGWFEDLAEVRGPDGGAPLLVHGDAAASNVLVDPGSGRVRALLDWGDAAIADPLSDLAKVEPRFLPEAVHGYADDVHHERRVSAGALAHQLLWAVGRLGDAPAPEDPTWSAQPGARLLGLLRMAADQPQGAWTDLMGGR